jgi:hypothetical protein
MVRRENKKGVVYIIPECTCNKKLKRVFQKTSRFNNTIESVTELELWAKDHEELHQLSRNIVDFIADTGKMTKEDIVENFPDYKEEQLAIAANLSMYPIVFPKKRRATPQMFEQLKQHAYNLTEEYRRAKYAPIDDIIEEESDGQ